MTASDEKSSPDNWKNHPVIIALLSGAAVAVFMMTVVFPAMTSVQGNALSNLSAQNEALSERTKVESKTAVDLRVALTEAAKSLRKFSTEFTSLAIGSVFEGKNPWPYGYRAIAFGDSEGEVTSLFRSQYTKHDGYVSVVGNKAPFGEVTYYFDDNNKVKYVSFFHMSQQERDFGMGIKSLVLVDQQPLVFQKLREAFGEPDLQRVSEGQLQGACWLNRSGVDIVHSRVTTMLFPAFEYKLDDCGSDQEVEAKRAAYLTCPLPKAGQVSSNKQSISPKK